MLGQTEGSAHHPSYRDGRLLYCKESIHKVLKKGQKSSLEVS